MVSDMIVVLRVEAEFFHPKIILVRKPKLRDSNGFHGYGHRTSLDHPLLFLVKPYRTDFFVPFLLPRLEYRKIGFITLLY